MAYNPGKEPPALPEPEGAVDIGDTEEPTNPRAVDLGYADSEVRVSTTLGGVPVVHDGENPDTAITVYDGLVTDLREWA